MARRRQRNAPRDYPRTARLNELLREVIADEIERIDDDELGFVSVTAIEVDSELTLAKVYVSSLDEDIDAQIAVLSNHRGAIKKAIGSQARIRRTPDLRFVPDPSVQTGGRIEEILATLNLDDSDESSGGDGGDAGDAAEGDAAVDVAGAAGSVDDAPDADEGDESRPGDG
ncbi:MAG: 30S ribosome-binding factor RbfA [Acidimicrobiales bacterium]